MKKIVSVIVGFLISAMLITMVGCGINPSNPSETGSGVQSGTDSQSDSRTEEESTGTQDESGETESETETETESNDDTQVGEYTITELNKVMWATTGVNVRSMPSTDGIKLGVLAKGQQVTVTGQCKENNWYRVDYNGAVGYVSNNYLSDEKVIVNTPNPDGPNSLFDTVRDVLGKSPKKVGTLYVIGNGGFQSYSYSDSKGTTYADLVTKVADSLKGVSNVYAMPIPLGSGVTLPEEYNGKVSVGNQEAAIDSVLKHMGSNVIEVDIFGKLSQHKDEYLYFRTDHHWTQLAAYYAYTEFCAAKGITPHSLDEYKHKAYDDFVGSFYFSYYENNKSSVQPLYNAPDIVYTYEPITGTKMTVTDSKGTSYVWPIIKDVSNYKRGVKYSCFIAGDNPYTIIENKDIKDGSSCIVVKESYGNAFVPFLADHYQTVHVIDQRYWDGNVIEFARANNVNDVIFANNLTAIGSSGQLKNFNRIIN